MQESMFINSQWPECESHKHFIHNGCNAFLCLHVHNICAKLCFSLNEYRSRKVFAKIMQYIYNNH